MNKHYKNILIFIFVIINCIEITNCYNASACIKEVENNINVQDRLEKIKAKGVLTVASSNEEAVFFIDPNTNEIKGIEGEIITEAAKRLGINKVQIKVVPFDKLFTQLYEDDEIDIIADQIYVTDERKKKMLFTNKWYKDFEGIITPKVSPIVFKEDLINASKVGVQVGTVKEEFAKKLKEEGKIKEVVLFPNQKELLAAVNAGKVDAGISDAITVTYALLKDKSLYLKVLSTKENKPELPGEVAAAVRKSDVTLANAINEVVDEMKRKGIVLDILKKYGLNESFYISVEDEK